MDKWKGRGLEQKPPTTLVYHGIDSHQRGGSAINKLADIIRSGAVFPILSGRDRGKDPVSEKIDSLQLAIVEHAVSHKIRTGEINVDEYLKQFGSDHSLTSNPAVQAYTTDGNFRLACQRHRLNIINVDHAMRTFVTWAEEDEQSILSTYGSEIYLEIEENTDKLYRTNDDSPIVTLVGPVPLAKIKRIVLSSQFAQEESKIRSMLEDRGLGKIKLEVRA